MEMIKVIKEEIIYDSGRSTADRAAALLLEKPELLKDFENIAFGNIYPYDMRASNVIEKADKLSHGFAKYLIPKIISHLPLFKNDGPRRQFLLMLIRYIKELSDEQIGVLYELSLKYATNQKMPVAVRNNSIRILNEICIMYPELKPDVFFNLKMRIHEEKEPFKKLLTKYINNKSN